MEKIRTFFLSHGIDGNERLAIAFSGGSDSLALLLSCSCYFKPDHLIALYVNHRLRDKAELENESVLNAENCRRIGVAYKELWLDEGQIEQLSKSDDCGIEAAARHMRYDLLLKYCEEHGYPMLATAHTGDDQLETMVMRTFNGSSPLSLTCIRDDWTMDGIRVIRPVLGYSKEELRLQLKVNGLTWSEDSTNGETAYLRNKIRTEIIPVIRRIFPEAKQIVARKTYLASGISNLVDEKVAQVYDGSKKIHIDAYKHQIPIVRYRILLFLLKNHSPVPYARLQYIDDFLLGSKEGTQHFDTYDIQLSDGVATYHAVCPLSHQCYPVPYGKDADIHLDNGLELKINSDLSEDDGRILRIADEDLKPPLVLRSPEPGDMLLTDGGKVAVSKLIASWKVGPAERQKCFVLEDGKGVKALFLRHAGGRDRLSRTLKKSLVSKTVRLYSIINKENKSE
ncbi:MAG: tRNA lysidine(34) synthetase TilS [Spirochaetia bacterium]|nr:tRNA lysidine(34) synthetase TilS [Spirochaetia bacterium]